MGGAVWLCFVLAVIFVQALEHSVEVKHRFFFHSIFCTENADSTSLNAVIFLKVSEVLTASSFGHLKVWDIRAPAKKYSKLMLL